MSASPVTARLSETAKENLDRFAKITKRSRSFIINEAVEQYLNDRIAYLSDLDDAVASIDNDKTHSADDVFAWMHSWGSKTEKPAFDALGKDKT